MDIVLKIGDNVIESAQLYPLLAKYRLLPQLAKELIIEQAIADINCSPEELATARQQFHQHLQITTDAQRQVWLEMNGMNEEDLEELAVRDLKVEKFKEITWESQLATYFAQCKQQLDRVVYSLIRTKDAGVAQELFFRIQEGESSFTDLAREYSEGSEAQTGGLIGPVELNVPHPQIAQVLLRAETGQVRPPIRVGDWWVVLRLEKYLSAQLDEPTRKRLLNDLFQGWLIGQMQSQVSYDPSCSAENP